MYCTRVFMYQHFCKSNDGKTPKNLNVFLFDQTRCEEKVTISIKDFKQMFIINHFFILLLFSLQWKLTDLFLLRPYLKIVLFWACV